MTTMYGWDGLGCDDSQVPPIDPRSVSKIGHELLKAVEQVYLDAGIALPDRHIWTAGEVAWDCELLAVSLDSLRADEPPNWSNPGITPCLRPIVGVFRIAVVRCVPTPNDDGRPPPVEEMALSADMTAIDAYLLMKSACRLDFWGWDQEPPNQNGGLGVVSTIEIGGPQGGMGAVTLVLTGIVG
jgi:hypothetical protein